MGAQPPPSARLRRDDLLASLPPPWPDDPLPAIAAAVRARGQKVFVLDDDPTGTQTVHGVPILTAWPEDALRAELANDAPVCYLLTNSRSLPADEAAVLGGAIGGLLAGLARATGREIAVISRSDSTLRGHFPVEVDALAAALGGVDATLVVPAFIAGGRYTVADIHYATEGEWLVPVGETEFARDVSFGFRASNLRQWVEEKTTGRVAAEVVTAIDIETIRCGGPDAVAAALLAVPPGGVCVANAAADRDLEVLALGALTAETQGRRILYRTAASFVPARAGLAPRLLLQAGELPLPPGGGLIVAGSYVQATSNQLAALRALPSLTAIEAAADALAAPERSAVEIARVAAEAEAALGRGEDVLVFTSRQLLLPQGDESGLALGRRISEGLVAIVRAIRTRPRYVLAKGGITSSDVAPAGLGVRRALVLGQLLAGVPVWELGDESRHPGLVYVVFPGNVGGPDALAQAVSALRAREGGDIEVRAATIALLRAAQAGGYALGAFNVYNLEGVRAVVGAAEELHSPAILQIHPAALRHGGAALVALCLAAADAAAAPLAVHLDHATDAEAIRTALTAGLDSVMADGSHLDYSANVAFTGAMAAEAHERGAAAEGELGRLSDTEDDLTVAEYAARLTDPEQAASFVSRTGVDALAVCIGNVHGHYRGEPRLDFERLIAVERRVPVPLVLHGASGLPEPLVRRAIALGVRKLNVNTELRDAYVAALHARLGTPTTPDLLDLMDRAIAAMRAVVAEKLRLFGSARN